MKRLVTASLLGIALASSAAGSAAADSHSERASCEGVLVSSATYPGEVADLGRALHQQLKDQGIPPGFLDVGAAQVKAGSLEACLAAVVP
jgi:hypothetical protein